MTLSFPSPQGSLVLLRATELVRPPHPGDEARIDARAIGAWVRDASLRARLLALLGQSLTLLRPWPRQAATAVERLVATSLTEALRTRRLVALRTDAASRYLPAAAPAPGPPPLVEPERPEVPWDAPPPSQGTYSGQIPIEPTPLPVEDLAWIEVELLDADGRPIAGRPFELTAYDGTVHHGTTDANGVLRVDGIVHGPCAVTFPTASEEEWRPAA